MDQRNVIHDPCGSSKIVIHFTQWSTAHCLLWVGASVVVAAEQEKKKEYHWNLWGWYKFDVSIVTRPGRARWPACKHVDDSVFNEWHEDERETDDHPDVDGFDVRDTRQRLSSTVAGRGRRQYSQQTDGDARRTRLDVDPKWNPRQDDNEDAWHVDLNDVVADVSLQLEIDFQTWICACRDAYNNNSNYNRRYATAPAIFSILSACVPRQRKVNRHFGFIVHDIHKDRLRFDDARV